MRKPFVAGNWKMNTDSQIAQALAKKLTEGYQLAADNAVDVGVIPPFVYLSSISQILTGSNISLGAQDVYFESNGAYTGEISTAMLKDVGCCYVLCGHSERRHVIGESDELINKKVSAAISGGLLPILCVGELLKERQDDKTVEVVTRQVKAGLKGLSSDKICAVTLAYEPVWAIGTGLTATPDQAQEVHKIIRDLISSLYDSDIASQMRIQYGGSAKPENAASLMAEEDIDGLLVGGASLKSEDFLAIIRASK